MATAAPRSAGFIASFRAFGDSLLAAVQNRIEIFTVELQEEKFRLIQTCIWISAAVFAGMMTITFASLVVVYAFWESARLAVLGGLTAVYAGALVAIIVALRRFLARQPKPFATTLHVIGDDRACIRKES
jgi:uncharacterized membrane protein YqjE